MFTFSIVHSLNAKFVHINIYLSVRYVTQFRVVLLCVVMRLASVCLIMLSESQTV
jgi:hypothetical protein